MGNELEKNKDNQDGARSMWKKKTRNSRVQNWRSQENFVLVISDI